MKRIFGGESKIMTGVNNEPIANLQEEAAGFMAEADMIAYVVGLLRGQKMATIYLSCPDFTERTNLAMKVWKTLKKGEARKVENNLGITIHTNGVSFFVPLHDDSHYNKDSVTHFLTWVSPTERGEEAHVSTAE